MTFSIGGTAKVRRIIKELPRWRCRCGIVSTRYSCDGCGYRRDRVHPALYKS